MKAKHITAIIVAIAATAAHAQFSDILTEGHTDISIFYEAQDGWTLAVADEVLGRELDPATTLLYVGEASRTTRPGGSEYDFLGVGEGDPLWVINQIETPGMLLLGVGSEEMPGDTFDSYFENDTRIQGDGRWITLSLKSVRGPGVWPRGNPNLQARRKFGMRPRTA